MCADESGAGVSGHLCLLGTRSGRGTGKCHLLMFVTGECCAIVCEREWCDIVCVCGDREWCDIVCVCGVFNMPMYVCMYFCVLAYI